MWKTSTRDQVTEHDGNRTLIMHEEPTEPTDDADETHREAAHQRTTPRDALIETNESPILNNSRYPFRPNMRTEPVNHRNETQFRDAGPSRTKHDRPNYAPTDQNRNQSFDMNLMLQTMNAILQQNAQLMANNRPNPRADSVGARSVVSYNIMPDFSKTISTFSGDDLTLSKKWIDDLQATARLHNCPPAFMLETAKTHLVGGAHFWFQTNRDLFQSCEHFRHFFCKHYIQEKDATSLWKRMCARIQSPKESINAYFHEKVHLCQQLELDFGETKEQDLCFHVVPDNTMSNAILLGRNFITCSNFEITLGRSITVNSIAPRTENEFPPEILNINTNCISESNPLITDPGLVT